MDEKYGFDNARKNVERFYRAISGVKRARTSNGRYSKRSKYNKPYLRGKLKKLLAAPLEIGYRNLDFTEDVSTTATVRLLNGLQRGTSATTRSSFNVGWISFQMRCSITVDTTSLSQRIRMVLVWDKQTNRATPAWLDVFDTATPETMTSLENSQRFLILRNYYFCLTGRHTAADMTSGSCRVMEEFFKMGNKRTRYDSDTNTGIVDEIASGGCFLMTIGSAAPGTAAANLDVAVRFRFTG